LVIESNVTLRFPKFKTLSSFRYISLKGLSLKPKETDDDAGTKESATVPPKAPVGPVLPMDPGGPDQMNDPGELQEACCATHCLFILFLFS
jgi:hypothetical protein